MVFSWLQLAVFMFLIGGLLFAGGPLILSALVAPKAKGGDMGMPYECGMKPHGRAWNQFGISYYVYALLFLAFDVDVLYLFPVAAWYHEADGLFAFIEVAGFLSVLAVAIIYFWKKGVFTWPRKIS